MNKIFLMGRITKVPEIKFTENNNSVTRFSLAVKRRYSKEGGERETDFVNIVAWNKTADFICKYFGKGQQILVTGRLENRSWEDENGKKHVVTEVIAEDVEFAESKKEETTTTETTANNSDNNSDSDTIEYTQEELPF